MTVHLDEGVTPIDIVAYHRY